MTLPHRPVPLPSAIRRLLSAVFAVALVAGAVGARAQDRIEDISGEWQQLSSSAGACAKCSLSFEQRGSSFTVTANNGWSASVDVDQQSNIPAVTGMGRWRENLTGSYAARPFGVDFVLQGQRLYMSMRVNMGNGSRRTIRGVYGRVWSGV